VSTPHRATPTQPLRYERRAPAVRTTLLLILALNAVVVVVKVAVGLRTHALSVLGAALESTLDLLNNVVGIVLVGIAALAPDEEHPYGHEKFETLGALAIAGFERRRGKRLGSAFLLADAEHTRSDIYVTLAALGSLVLARLGWGMVDPVLALAVALVIAWHGFEIVRGTVPVLVDARAVDAEQLSALLRSIPRVLDVRTVRSRASASGLLFAEVTIGVDGATTVAEAHEISDAVEARIAEELGASEVTVHIEPA
jgi:divalent metal cation (Fe/Co/Zn/Cd) transporter